MTKCFKPNYNEEYIEHQKSLFINHYQTILKNNRKSFHDGFQISKPSDIQFTNTIFGITITYNHNFNNRGNNYTGVLEYINKALNDIYREICKEIIDGNFTRKKYLQPLLIAFVDASGSKHSFHGESQLGDEPHHHGVIQIHPYLIKKWNEINNKEYWASMARKYPAVKTIHLDPIASMDDLDNWLSYSTKFSLKLKNSAQYSDQLDVILPKLENGERESLIYPEPLCNDPVKRVVH